MLGDIGCRGRREHPRRDLNLFDMIACSRTLFMSGRRGLDQILVYVALTKDE